jgi:P22 coat protein - gene protein 5
MANSVLTYGLIARRATEVLENNLVFANQVFRGYEAEYSRNVNGYKPGATITIRRPAEFIVNDGPVVTVQDASEGSVQITVNLQKNIGMNFTSKDMTLDITDFSERFIEPAMISMAQQVDQDCASMTNAIPNWVGTPGNVLSNFNSFAAATQRLDDTSIGTSPRTGIVSPADARGLQANLTGPSSIFAPELVSDVYRQGKLPPLDGVELFKTQNYFTQLTGTRTQSGAGTLNGGTLSTTWAATKDTNTMTLTMTAIGTSATVITGEVFTLAGVYDVNPRSKVALPYLKQFVVTAGFTADASGNCSPVISPPIITSGAYQNVSAAPATNAAVTWVGAASGTFVSNVVFNKNAFALVMVPLEKPEGGLAKVARMSHKGTNVRILSWYDGINDNNLWRFDVLYGTKTIDPRQAVRLSGT